MSLLKKTKSLIQYGLKPIETGINNYNKPTLIMESTANERAKVCQTEVCGNFVDEPIDFMRIEDERIPTLSGKMCDECGCALPYLLRQNIKICKYWKA
jgi:hypothetical protein